MSEYSGFRAGRTAPFTLVPEWVLVAPITAEAKSLYMALIGHENFANSEGGFWPGMDAVAEMLGFPDATSLTSYIAELAALGAIDVHQGISAEGRETVYTIHHAPPEGYEGALTVLDAVNAAGGAQ